MSAETRACPDGLLPDGPLCPRCGGSRAPSGVGGGTWVHVSSPGKRASREIGNLLAEVRKAEDAARLEGHAQGFADCETRAVLKLEAMAVNEMKLWCEKLVTDAKARAFALQGAAQAIHDGQLRTDAYDPEELARAHRRASTSPAMASAGGKARQAKLTPKQKTKLAKMAATARWKRGEERGMR